MPLGIVDLASLFFVLIKLPLCSVTTLSINLSFCGVLDVGRQICSHADFGLFSAGGIQLVVPNLNFLFPLLQAALAAAAAAAAAGDATGSRPMRSRVCSVSTNESGRLTGVLAERALPR